jgi:hypothetical protein
MRHTCLAQKQLHNLGSHPRTYHPSHHAPNTHILTPPTRPRKRLGPYAPVARSCPSILLRSRLIARPRAGRAGFRRRLNRLETAIHRPLAEVRDGCTADEWDSESHSRVGQEVPRQWPVGAVYDDVGWCELGEGGMWKYGGSVGVDYDIWIKTGCQLLSVTSSGAICGDKGRPD